MAAGKIGGDDLLAIERDLLQESFADFVRAAWPIIEPATPLQDNWHVEAICDHLQALYEGKDFHRLLINIPPGFSKSLLVSVLFPVWVWTREPSTKILSTAHQERLAIRDTRKSRLVISSKWFQRLWPMKLQDDQNQKSYYENEHLGARESKAFTSTTGSRGDILIVDDPHSVNDAKSEIKRTEAVETFWEGVTSRLNDPVNSKIVVIMQRLHEEDLSGSILERDEAGALGYCHLCIPMEYEGPRAPTPIGWTDPRTEDGELLHPERFPAEKVLEKKTELGTIAYAGQYQQRPAPKTDGFFRREWFKRYKLGQHPKGCTYYMTSDHAPAGKQDSDYNVLRIWAVDSNRSIWLVDSFVKRCKMDIVLGVKRIDGGGGRIELAEEGALPLIKKWRPLAWFPENDNNWKAISGFVVAAMRDTGVLCTISPLSVAGSKMEKAAALQAKASVGGVYYPEGTIGDEALDQLARFPNGKHDDMVDADTNMCRAIGDAVPGFVAAVEEPVDYRRDYDAESREIGYTDTFY